ncbi:MAG: Flp pilus assembly protein CpaB [Sphingomicrobium sp.]
MRRQTLLALAVAIFLGLAAVFLANSFLSKSEAQNDARATTKVAVAAVPLDYGTDLTADNVRFVDFPSTSVPPGAFTNATQLLPAGKRRVALMRMAINEPILSSKVTGEGQNASIAALLPDGMRAASVRINDVSGVAGFVQPNDSVDVLITRSAPNGQQITDVLLQNTRVIAMGQDAQRADGQPVVAATATLEVDPLAAQKLALAQQIGSLSLVLRKPGALDNNPLIETVSLQDLRYGRYRGTYPNGPPVQQPAAPSGPRAQPRPVVRATAKPAPRTVVRNGNVEVVRGTASTNYEVGRYGS